MNSKKANFIILLAVLLLGIALGVIGFMIHESYVQRQETAAATPEPTPVPTPTPTPTPTPSPPPPFKTCSSQLIGRRGIILKN